MVLLKLGAEWWGDYFATTFFFLIVLKKKIFLSPKQFCSLEFKIERNFFPVYLLLQEDCKFFDALMSILFFSHLISEKQ